MTHADSPIVRFFSLFARHTNENDIAAILTQFADPFLSAGPSGTQSVRLADFAAALPKRKALFERLGAQPAELVDIRETPLDFRYILARTTWRMSFSRSDAPPYRIDVESTFLVDTFHPGANETDFKILLYLSHQDLMQILRDQGIYQPAD